MHKANKKETHNGSRLTLYLFTTMVKFTIVAFFSIVVMGHSSFRHYCGAIPNQNLEP